MPPENAPPQSKPPPPPPDDHGELREEPPDFHRAQLRTEELRSQIAYHEHHYFVLDARET
jgi:hypothetical protein